MIERRRYDYIKPARHLWPWVISVLLFLISAFGLVLSPQFDWLTFGVCGGSFLVMLVAYAFFRRECDHVERCYILDLSCSLCGEKIHKEGDLPRSILKAEETLTRIEANAIREHEKNCQPPKR